MSVESPQNGTQVGDRYTLRGTATPSMIVEVTGSARGSVYADRRGRWQMPLSSAGLPIGESIRLRVVAKDSSGNVSPPVHIRYAAAEGNPNPNTQIRFSVYEPVQGSLLGKHFRLTGTATPNTLVEVTGTLRGTVYTDRYGNWSMRLSTRDLAPGTMIYLSAQARDSYGNFSRVVPVKYAKR